MLLARPTPPTCCSPPPPCSFVEITAGFSLLFSSLLVVGAVAAARRRSGALDPECASVACFGAAFWLAAATAATTRGQQADAAGLPQGDARSAVAAVAWLAFTAFALAAGAVGADRLLQHRRRLAHARAAGSLTVDEEPGPLPQFKTHAQEREERAGQLQRHVSAPAAFVSVV